MDGSKKDSYKNINSSSIDNYLNFENFVANSKTLSIGEVKSLTIDKKRKEAEELNKTMKLMFENSVRDERYKKQPAYKNTNTWNLQL